jgi:dTDP-4-amino-4,6-dideoxygalactose transaminase
MCAHLEPAYAQEPWSCGSGEGRCACPPPGCARLRESERAQEQCIILPLFHEMTDEEQERVADTLRQACAAATRGYGGAAPVAAGG